MTKDWKREYFSIPNLMGYFRIILIPIYAVIYINADSDKEYFMAAMILVISALTDLLDGKIARRFDMITDWGKVLDPIADKLTQGIVVISLIFRYEMMKMVLAVFIGQQLFMGIMGLFFMKKTKKVQGAKMYGKISTAFLDVMIILLIIWVEIPLSVANVLMIISICLMIIALCGYTIFYRNSYNELQSTK